MYTSLGARMISRVGRKLRAIAALAALAFLSTSCSYLYPSAAVLRGNVPVLFYKECGDTSGVASVVIRQGVPGDKRTPIVWTARLRKGATPLFELPLLGEIPSYEVVERQVLDAEAYYFADAEDSDGYALGGPAFRLKDLRPQRALISSDPEFGREYEALSKWEKSSADCPANAVDDTGRFATILAVILLIGLVLSAIVIYQDRRRRKTLAQS